MVCKHKDGWVLKEQVGDGQDDLICEFECNTLGCKERRLMEFDISKARLLSEEQINDLKKNGYNLNKKGVLK